jgi:hypothetical protein
VILSYRASSKTGSERKEEGSNEKLDRKYIALSCVTPSEVAETNVFFSRKTNGEKSKVESGKISCAD